ncbi:putative non-specific protein-tyrosine kinase RLK-Pelle-LRR-V family [Helianthus annuus]|nr:putative non-specific protein-tyrosine kinase RLK-Pelle-LRR-V family [Helianthus annuus]KAJ0636953.1 putative non-specific protein-tyrosine kinase RLK-Pelle-LRR-V family [Helianthus annuus]KAJ0814028.1 putative non-specific protein-tyrosine kinase RLK-Pelle-LRR-V family [Helianthus annuus]
MNLIGSMGVKRFILYLLVFFGFILIFVGPISLAITNATDVSAINNLCAALGSPDLTGWTATAGDPCDEKWQGVVCDTTNTKIISITVHGANSVRELGDTLGAFSSLQSIDLSNNFIGGSFPTDLPVTLTNIDLSGNSLSGELPSSLHSLSSLTTFHLQNNKLSGTLDVLQDLPLRDLNIENNLFTGPIPDKLLTIPDFKSDGNPLNATTRAAPPASPNTTTSTGSGTPFFPSPKQTPGKQVPQASGPSSAPASNSTSKSWSAKKIVWVSIASVFGFIVLALVCLLFSPRRFRRKQIPGLIPKRHEITPYIDNRVSHIDNRPFAQPTDHVDKAPKVATVVPPKSQQQPLSPPLAPSRRPPGPRLGPHTDKQTNVQRLSAISKQDSMEIDMSRFDIDSLRPPPPPPPPAPLSTSQPIHLPFEKVIVEPAIPVEAAAKPLLPHMSVRSYTIASLQQYTNSFSQDNYIGRGMLGSVYRAQLPNGKLLAVKKLEKKVINQQTEEDFIELVSNLDKIRHANVVELMGYCSEHGQRLLIYEYCSSGTLHDALHSDDGYKKKFSWNARIRMALGAARALEYLHDFSEPPVIHRNFKSANVLLDEDLSVRVSDCGLAPLISRGSVSQLSGQLLSTFSYGAPEFELGIYTSMSDVYSLGVVMLELLTGRKPYDSTRHRGEQLLVRWAVPQLHDIDALSRMVDPSLNGEYPVKSLSNFADIISRCVQTEPEFRPPMSEVVQDLIQMIRRESSNRSDGD